MYKNVITVKIVPKKSHLKVPGGLKSQQTLTAWPFPVYCPFMGGYFSSVDYEMGLCVCLREVSAYVRLKM